MSTDLVRKLNATKAKVAALEKKIASQRNRELSKLPARYGFRSMGDFIAALQTSSGRPGAKTVTGTVKRKGRKPRAKITADTKTEVKKLAEAGKTGAEIAQSLAISLPSVQNIKKELGLVRKR